MTIGVFDVIIFFMEKKVTIYDIAKMVGVSAATVSYVINNAEGHSISEETRSKVWHAVNLLNYKPNVFAKNLRSSSSKLVAVCTECNGFIERAEFMSFLEKLSSSLRDNFDLILCTPPFGHISNADAIIAYNLSKETFYDIGNQNYIPLISVHCLVEDKLFFQVSIDYSRLKEQADAYFDGEYTFVSLKPSDSALENDIDAIFDKVLYIDDCKAFDIPNGGVLTTSGMVTEVLETRGYNVLYVDTYTPVCRQTADCIVKALSREKFDVHSYKI